MADVKDRLEQIDERIMAGLKDFQRATVERIDYLYRHDQRRGLVSDEVGLGISYIQILYGDKRAIFLTSRQIVRRGTKDSVGQEMHRFL